MASNSDSTAVGISAENIPANSEIEMGSTNIVGSQAGASTSAGVLKTMPIILLGVSAVVIVILAIFVGLLAGGVFNNTNTNTNTKVIYRNLTQSPSLSPNQVPSRVPFVSGTVQVTAWASTPTTINPPELSVLGPITSATTGMPSIYFFHLFAFILKSKTS